jgi:hypothetical protein
VIETIALILMALAGVGLMTLALMSRTLRRLVRWADGWSEVGRRLPSRREPWP